MDTNNRRHYKRSAHFNCMANISKDGGAWSDARVSNVSSGGLCFASTTKYAVGEELHFDLCLEGFLSQLHFTAKGCVRHKSRLGNNNIYGIEFMDLSEYLKVRIDENVRRDRPIERKPYPYDGGE